MHFKNNLKSLIVLGFLVGCTFSPRTFAPAGFRAALLSASTNGQILAADARALRPAQQESDAWKAYLPLVIKNTPPPATQTPTPTPTTTSTPTSTPTPTQTFTPVPTGCTLTHNGAFDAQLYVLINNERANVGLAPLTENYQLENSAGEHSDDMAINHFMDHTGSDGSTFWQRAVRAGYTGHWGGEIIMGGNSPEAAVAWWMSDGPHRDMILGDLNDFGAGYAQCSSNYFTVDFGHQ